MTPGTIPCERHLDKLGPPQRFPGRRQPCRLLARHFQVPFQKVLPGDLVALPILGGADQHAERSPARAVSCSPRGEATAMPATRHGRRCAS